MTKRSTHYTIYFPTAQQRIAAGKMLDKAAAALGFSNRNRLLLSVISAPAEQLAAAALPLIRKRMQAQSAALDKSSELIDSGQLRRTKKRRASKTKRVTPMTIYLPAEIDKSAAADAIERAAQAVGLSSKNQLLISLFSVTVEEFTERISATINPTQKPAKNSSDEFPKNP